ncbi:MAG: alpha/beta hydrolase [Gammaproteobacteria bacterium]|nr:alpha/beta hydrolase [Gammaproteobacteria bacterium]
MFWLLFAVFVIWAVTRFYLSGEDLSAYDSPAPQPLVEQTKPSAEHHKVVQSLGQLSGMGEGVSRKQRLQVTREYLDSMGEDVTFDGEIIPLTGTGFKGEWLVPSDSDSSCRTLYIHGGAFVMGSPLSHRAITTKYALLTGGPVLSLDYRLMPENSRQAGIDDCRMAYRWLLENAPDGKLPVQTVYVSGDSAGGNLTLSLSAWIRDQGLRAPNAVVALSPATDSTLGGGSFKTNEKTDYMLGPLLSKINRVPRWLLQWMGWFSNRINPADPRVSPVLGDLGGLPPTLVQASLGEMLLDDSVRYVNKARASGSPAELQTWQHMVHVWQIFVRELPEAQDAFVEIDKFLQAHRGEQLKEAAA